MNFLTVVDDVVSAWLLKQDKVSEISGKPTWFTLVTALQRVGQNGIAAAIIREKEGTLFNVS
jgi:hypothetical protein